MHYFELQSHFRMLHLYYDLMGYIKQRALSCFLSLPFEVCQLNTTLFIKLSVTPVNCVFCDLNCGVGGTAWQRILPVAQVLKPLRYSLSRDISAPSFRLNPSPFWKTDGSATSPSEIPNHSLYLSNASVKSLQVLCLLTSGSFRETGDNIIEYKAHWIGSSPCQDQFQVRGCEKAAKNSLKSNCEISPCPQNTHKYRGSSWKPS